MKSSKSLIIGLLSAAVCVGCVLGYAAMMNQQANAARAEALERYGGDQIEVCVASRDIAPGETVTDSMIERKLWVAALLPQNAVSESSEVVGKQTNAAVYAGEPLVSGRFGLDAAELNIPAGYTALSVPAKTVQAVGGAIKTGMYVDLYATGPSSTVQLLEHALVLATNAEAATASKDAIAWVVLAVEPARVEELIAATQTLELTFALPQPDESHQADESKGTSETTERGESR